jgi:pimeloyl-ACP methyl ester carboxylesterase
MWDAQIPQLEQYFRILRYDTRGQGRSSVTPGDYTIEQLGRDVLGLLDALGLERVHFCGLSMGGMIGIWLGVHAPAAFIGLCCAIPRPVSAQKKCGTRVSQLCAKKG